YYVDGVLSVYITMCIILLLIISDRKIDINRNYAFFVLGMIIMIGGNIKFTGLGYMGIFCIFYYILWLINAYKQKIFLKTFKYCTTFYIIVLIATVGIAGFSSYVMNTAEKGNPLYPLIGKDKVDIMSFNQPEQFDDYNNVQKLFVSLFAETSDVSEMIDASEKIKLKIPLHVSIEEVKQCMRTSDIRLGGFGPLFSGMFILMVILIIYGEYKLFKKNRYLTIQLIGIECIMTVLIFCVDGGWWARYSGYSYILVACAMVIGYNMKRGRALDFIYKFLLTLTVINTCIMMLAVPRGIIYSQKQYKTLKMIKNRCDKEDTSVNIALQSDSFNGNMYNLMDYDIPFNIVEYDDNLEQFNEFCFYGFEK
nr:hypothetical protein [Lachnospiraceae bacterium]